MPDGTQEPQVYQYSAISPYVWWDQDVDETDEEETQIDQYDITASPNDFNIKTIYDFLESGVVEIPGFQRNYVWDKKRASKLIESIIIGLPIPQIFLYEAARNKFLVIDGQQRLMSIYYFIKQRFPKKDKRNLLRKIYEENNGIPNEVLHNDDFFERFNLILPEKLPNSPNRFNKINYETLGEYKTTFELRVIRNIIIKQNLPKQDDSSIYEIFNRLNSGGINLKPQEIRTSLYHSDLYKILYKVNTDIHWRKIIGVPDPDLHMKDVEFLLRGCAMLIDGHKYKPSMTKFLNNFSKNCKSVDSNKIEYIEKLLFSFLQKCSNLPDGAFYSRNNKFSITVFEAVFSTICKGPFEKGELVLNAIDSAKIDELKNDEKFIIASQKETASAANVQVRRDRAVAILLG